MKGQLTWFKVSVNALGFSRTVSPPGRAGFSDSVEWSKINRVCFKLAPDVMENDELFVFSSERKVIPFR